MSTERFSEEEFALILRRATELQARALPAPAGEDRGQGMSIGEIKAIAGEAGIDPVLVERAALAIARERAAPERPLAEKFVLSDSMPGQMSEEDRVRVVQAIRAASLQHGEAEFSPTGLEWSNSSGEPTRLHVSVHSLEGRNEVTVAVDRTASAVLTHIFPTLGGFLIGVASAASIEPSAAVGIAFVVAGAGTGLGVARTIWRVNSRKIQARARGMLDAVRRALPSPDADV